MADNHVSTRYRNWYAKLLRHYPEAYYERFGKSMEQTFNDLCSERQKSGKGLFGFALWTFSDTAFEIIKKDKHYMTSLSKQSLIMTIVAIVGLAILITVYITNGSEREDAWLYIFSAWLVISPAIDLFFKKRREEKDKNK